MGSIRREMLDHVIPLNERHLMRLSLEYVRYYQDDRTHLGLNKETPSARLTEMRPDLHSTIGAEPNRRSSSSLHVVGSGVNGARGSFSGSMAV